MLSSVWKVPMNKTSSYDENSQKMWKKKMSAKFDEGKINYFLNKIGHWRDRHARISKKI